VNNLELHVITKSQQESIQAILDSGALNVENGDVTLHFQGNIIQSIEIRVKAYQLKKMPLDFSIGTVLHYQSNV
jgi:hypothetical protein